MKRKNSQVQELRIIIEKMSALLGKQLNKTWRLCNSQSKYNYCICQSNLKQILHLARIEKCIHETMNFFHYSYL